MDFLKNIFGTGANIFGASPSNTDALVKNGLLQQTDVDKAKNQSLVRGLLGAGIGYLAQPQNKGYGSITPYLAKGFQQGMEQAQKPFDKLVTDANQNVKLEDYKFKKDERENKEKFSKGLFKPNSSITEFNREADPRLNKTDVNGVVSQVAPNFNPITPSQKPVFDSEKYLQTSLANGIIKGEDYFKYKNLINPTKDPISVAAGGALYDPVTKKPIFVNPKNESTGNYRDYEMTTNNPTPKGFGEWLIAQNNSKKTEISLGDDGSGKIQDKLINYVVDTNKDINSGIKNQQEMDLAASLVEQASSAQGFGSGLIEKVSGVADRLGIPMASNDKADILRVLQSAQIKLALGEKKPGTGPMTDADFLNYLKTTVNIDNPQATNRIIAYLADKKQKMRQDFGSALNAYVKENGYDMGVFEFEKQWNAENGQAYKDEMEAEIQSIVKRSNIKKRNPNLTESELDQAIATEDEVVDIINSSTQKDKNGY
jgi:hypothetical protein